jgi:hypothetical protein
MTDVSGPLTPQKERIGVYTQMFGIIAAPAFWIGQLIFAYGLSAQACYGGDHPAAAMTSTAITTSFIVFDVAAVAAAIVGLVVSIQSCRIAREQSDGARFDMATTESRERFMAIWGVFSSLAFLSAIIFNVIASLTVPPCAA